MSRTPEFVHHFARRTPAAVALSDPDQSITYKELWDRIRTLVILLRDSGVRVLGFLADNSIDWACLDLAASCARVVTVPLPTFFSEEQIEHAMRDCGADAIVADESARDHFPELPFVAVELPGTSMRLYRRTGLRSKVSLPQGTAKISYTSGTTGSPKGVCLSQSSMDAVADSLVLATRTLGLLKHLCLLPLATLLENVGGVYAALTSGAEVALPGLTDIGWTGAARLDADRVCRLLRDERPNSIILVPEMLRLLAQAVDGGWVPPDTLRFVAVGGGHVSVDQLEQAERLGLPVFEGYGLTECASVVALNTPEARRLGSAGRPLPHVRIRVQSDGEIVIGGSTMLGYVGQLMSPQATFRTGDLGQIDRDGYLHVQGRKRNVFINSFGRNVCPDWIEPEFLRGTSIRQIAIFGEARPWNVAIVVPNPIAARAEIATEIEMANSRLPDYARVTDYIVADAPFTPENGLLTSNGRIRRDSLRDKYALQIRDCYDKFLRDSA